MNRHRACARAAAGHECGEFRHAMGGCRATQGGHRRPARLRWRLSPPVLPPPAGRRTTAPAAGHVACPRDTHPPCPAGRRGRRAAAAVERSRAAATGAGARGERTWSFRPPATP